MTVAELKDYLKMRGVTTSGHLKPALLEIALAVEKMMMPIDPNHEYGNEVGTNNQKYIIHDMVIEQPLSYPVVKDFTDAPAFGLYDIFNCLIYSIAEWQRQRTWGIRACIFTSAKCDQQWKTKQMTERNFTAILRAYKLLTSTACPYPNFSSFGSFLCIWKAIKRHYSSISLFQTVWISCVAFTSTPSTSLHHLKCYIIY